MKRLLLPLFYGAMLWAGCRPGADAGTFIQPAEWEPQEAVFMGWDGAWQPKDTVHLIAGRIIRAISESQKVVLWVTSDSLKQDAEKSLAAQKIPVKNIEIVKIPGQKLFWARDISPAFVVNDRGERRAVDFNHTGYIRYRQRYIDMGFDSAKLQAAIKKDFDMLKGDSLMAVTLGEQQIKSWMNIEGGAYEVNGKGSLVVGEPFLFRNVSKAMADTLSKEDFELEFKRTLGVNNVIWMGEGLAEDEGWGNFFDGKYITGGTRGHVDEFARFVNPNTIFLAWVDEKEADKNTINKLNYARMRENCLRLLQARDQDGKPFNIVKVPLPDLFYRGRALNEKDIPNPALRLYYQSKGYAPGDSLFWVGAGSYLNFLITNDKVIIPSYIAGGSSPEKEERVKKIFESYFPSRKLVFVDARYFNLGGGGIHCTTRQLPAKRVKG